MCSARKHTDGFAALTAGAFEPQFFRGFCGSSVIIRRFLNLASTCKELAALVTNEALPALAARMHPRLMGVPRYEGWRMLELARRLCPDPWGWYCSLAEVQVCLARAGPSSSLLDVMCLWLSWQSP